MGKGHLPQVQLGRKCSQGLRSEGGTQGDHMDRVDTCGDLMKAEKEKRGGGWTEGR